MYNPLTNYLKSVNLLIVHCDDMIYLFLSSLIYLLVPWNMSLNDASHKI